MYAEERQQAIARLITERQRLSVAALAEEYSVTTETVRRDLSQLERLGLVRRVHGGAVPAGSLATIEAELGERAETNSDLKERSPRPPWGSCRRRAPRCSSTRGRRPHASPPRCPSTAASSPSPTPCPSLLAWPGSPRSSSTCSRAGPHDHPRSRGLRHRHRRWAGSGPTPSSSAPTHSAPATGSPHRTRTRPPPRAPWSHRHTAWSCSPTPASSA